MINFFNLILIIFISSFCWSNPICVNLFKNDLSALERYPQIGNVIFGLEQNLKAQMYSNRIESFSDPNYIENWNKPISLLHLPKDSKLIEKIRLVYNRLHDLEQMIN